MTTEILPYAALGALALVFACFVGWAQQIRGPEDSFPLSILRAISVIYGRCVHRLRVEPAGEDPVPRGGAFILVSNHRSGVDPVLIAVMTLRRVRFLIAREYYEVPLLHRMCRALRCIPVDRDGSDLAATRVALRALHEGGVIGVFPQGGIRDAGAPMEGKSGIALLAIRSGAPVIPLRVEGSPNLKSVFRALVTPSRTTIRAGKPIRFEKAKRARADREELERVAAEILAAVESLGEREASVDS